MIENVNNGDISSEKETARQAPLKTGASTRLLPPSRMTSAIPWVISIMIALVVIAAGGGLALRNLSTNAQLELSNSLTVQIVEADSELKSDQAAQVAQMLSEEPSIARARIIPANELSELLSPWLGEAAQDQTIPIPALIDVQLVQSASAQQIEKLETQILAIAPAARLDRQTDWLTPVYSALRALQYLALALILLLAFACAGAVWLAARNGFTNHRKTVEIMHLLGASDRQVARIFERSVMRDAAIGSVIGLIMGLAIIWLLSRQFSALDSGMISGGGFGWLDWAVIAAIPVMGIGLAFVTGRLTILRALGRMP